VPHRRLSPRLEGPLEAGGRGGTAIILARRGVAFGRPPLTVSDNGLSIARLRRRAAQSLKNLRWCEVAETRGHIEDGKVKHYRVVLKIGFAVDDILKE
jgi:flavin-binding protein dodecin